MSSVFSLAPGVQRLRYVGFVSKNVNCCCIKTFCGFVPGGEIRIMYREWRTLARTEAKIKKQQSDLKARSEYGEVWRSGPRLVDTFVIFHSCHHEILVSYLQSQFVH